MRFGQAAQAGAAPVVHFTIDGKAITALEGDTIASALYAAGIRAWRRSRSGDLRGLLCGIGVCFDCLVRLDGQVEVRACQTRVAEGMVVETNLESGIGLDSEAGQ